MLCRGAQLSLRGSGMHLQVDNPEIKVGSLSYCDSINGETGREARSTLAEEVT